LLPPLHDDEGLLLVLVSVIARSQLETVTTRTVTQMYLCQRFTFNKKYNPIGL
jgi:hypothetical protein